MFFSKKKKNQHPYQCNVPFNILEHATNNFVSNKLVINSLSFWSTQDINFVLKNFASNIIFSNGLRDPYSAGG